MSSKSANYCYPNREKTTGLMLLAEVALGDMYQLTQAQYMDQPPQVTSFENSVVTYFVIHSKIGISKYHGLRSDSS